jgi:hypothetical protein
VRRRRIAIAAAIGVTAAAGTAVVLARRAPAEAPCTDGAAGIASTWNDARAAKLAAGFAAAGASASWPAVHDTLDGYARAWAVAHDDACRATRVIGSQTEAILDLRMLCLERTSASLEAVVAPLATGDRAAIARAHDAVALLPDLAACADVARMGDRTQLPANPARRARIATVDRAFAALEVHIMLEDTVDLRATAATALADGKSTGWPPLVAEGELRAAQLIEAADDRAAAERAFRDAARDALQAGDDEDAANAMIGLGRALAFDGKGDESAVWLDLARGEVHRVGDPPDLASSLLLAASASARAAGDLPGSAEDARLYLDGELHAWHGDTIAIAIARSNYAMALEEAGRIEDASREIATALEEGERALGKDHPRIALILEKQALIANAADRLDEGVAAGRRAVAILEAWYGPDDARLIPALQYLGAVEFHRDHTGARATLERQEALEKKTGASATDRARTEGNLAALDEAADDDEAALRHSKEALEILEGTVDANSPDLIVPLLGVSSALRHLDHLDESLTYAQRAVVLADRAYGPGNQQAFEPRLGLAYTLIQLDKSKEALAALAPLEDAVVRGHDVSPSYAATVRLALAGAYWAAGDHARARADAIAARDGFAAAGPSFAGERDQVVGWLEEHP